MKNNFFLVAVLLVVAISCKKKTTNTNPVAIAETCSDGIKNQGETAIDCGGPCTPCVVPINVLCDGRGSTSYWPFASGNKWFMDGPGTADITYTVASTLSVFNTISYSKVTSSVGAASYFRVATNGDIVEFSDNYNQEYLFIPANPTVNQSWAYPLDFSATRKVISITATVTTSKCTYTNCIRMQHFDANGVGGVTSYFKKGVGIVRTDQLFSGAINSDLSTIILN
jgi:hypothetical protein